MRIRALSRDYQEKWVLLKESEYQPLRAQHESRLDNNILDELN